MTEVIRSDNSSRGVAEEMEESEMKKTVLCVLLVVVMLLSLSACGKKAEPETTTAPAAAPVETAAARELTLTDWALSASTWSSPNGATIHLTAAPSSHADGDSADFVVRLEGENVSSTPCTWENNNYVASVDLNAADGYCYYVVLKGADGTSTEVAVNTPADPIDENYIDMASALESYCSLTLEDASLSDGVLTIANGVALVQAPRITDDGSSIACAQATLVLTLGGEEIGTQALTMAPGDANKSYEASLNNVTFSVPGTVSADQTLTLRLDATLTNGQPLSADGISWYYQDSALVAAVG